ncbi:hypothetical protein PIB30_035096 [Stylosanthes scabra]|uniref:Ubiquitin-like protease family profile domain-containing protein n=1 Tax=Stylosanthes scabra TaxID=79078 RepID=A0ABU6RD84_9FABA|nr:hypothetical protein [Stylosanthes scabra]
MKRKLQFSEDEGVDDVNEVRQEGRGTPFTFNTHDGPFMIGADMPYCFNLVCQPPDGIQFIGRELAVAAFIFADVLPKKEILVPDDHCIGSRENLQTLSPGRMLVDDVLNLVVSMCTAIGREARQRYWWLPTTFAQIALSPLSHCASTLDFIGTNYMGDIDGPIKIYVPLHLAQHWYLMIVDLNSEELVYLDSAKTSDAIQRKARLDQMKYVTYFLENMLADENFNKHKDEQKSNYRRFSLYDLSEPLVGQQRELSNDCGVYVAQWMIQSHLWEAYNLVVTDETRMRLAIDLVTNIHNVNRHQVADRAVEDWDKIVLRWIRNRNQMQQNQNSP